MNRRELVVLVALVLLGAALSYWLGRSAPLGRHVGDSAVAARIIGDKASPELSHGTADLTIVLFTDYRCPACRGADLAMRRAIARDGNVRVVYKDWPIFGDRSEQIARIALAAHRQGIYPAVHHALMQSRSLDDAELRRIVERSGGSWPQLQSDLVRHGPWIANQLARNGQDAFGLGLKGTPGYLIGPLLVEGGLNEHEFLQAFGEARAELRKGTPN